jgi:hypothetical protein
MGKVGKFSPLGDFRANQKGIEPMTTTNISPNNKPASSEAPAEIELSFVHYAISLDPRRIEMPDESWLYTDRAEAMRDAADMNRDAGGFGTFFVVAVVPTIRLATEEEIAIAEGR